MGAPIHLNELYLPATVHQLAAALTDPAIAQDDLRMFARIADMTPWLAQPADQRQLHRPDSPIASDMRIALSAVRAAIAANPNTPVDLLLELAVECPREFLANPALPLLLLEDPRLLEQLSLPAVNHLLCSAETPAVIVQAIARTPGTTYRAHMARETAQFHVNAAREASSTAERARGASAESGATGFTVTLYHPLVEVHWSHVAPLPAFFSQSSLALLLRFPAFWEAFAHCPDLTSAQLHTHLAHDPPVRFDQSAIAVHPAADTRLLAELASDAEPTVRRAVAYNPHTPLPLLTQLAHDAAWEVRAAVALHPATPASLLASLATDALSAVRSAVASRQSTPPDLLASLGSDAEAGVRAVVAANPATPRATVIALLDDDELPVRVALAGNPHLPMSDLVRLFTDTQEPLRRAAAQSLLRRNASSLGRLWRRHGFPLAPAQLVVDSALPVPYETLIALLDAYQEYIPQALAMWRHASPRLLTALAATEFKAGYANPHPAVARHRNTPTPALRMLVQRQKRHGWIQTMEALLQNPATQPELLETIFLADPDRLGQAVMRHPAMTDDLRAALYRSYCMGVVGKGVQPPDELVDYSEKNWRNRVLASEYYWSALASPHLDAQSYQKGAASFDWRDRCVVAHNEVAPSDEIERLASDGNRFVSAAARVNLARRQGWTCERVGVNTLYPRVDNPNINTPGDPELAEERYVTITLRLTPPDAPGASSELIP